MHDETGNFSCLISGVMLVQQMIFHVLDVSALSWNIDLLSVAFSV
jgi:hypothetical protein